MSSFLSIAKDSQGYCEGSSCVLIELDVALDRHEQLCILSESLLNQRLKRCSPVIPVILILKESRSITETVVK